MAVQMRDYEKDAESIRNFLETFIGYNELLHEKDTKYLHQIALLARGIKSSIVVSLSDLRAFDAKLCSYLMGNAQRYCSIFSNAIQSILEADQSLLQGYLATCEGNERTRAKCRSTLDVYLETRRETQQPKSAVNEPPHQRVPRELLCRFEVYFSLPEDTILRSIRDVKSESIGHLLSIKAIVTRASEVRPRLEVGTYTCTQCGSDTFQPVSGVTYIPLFACPSKDCQTNKRNGSLEFQTRGSKFCRFQELRIQELSDQVPVGHIPRSLTVWCAGQNCRKCQPGNNVVVTGTLLPVQRISRGRVTNRGLLTDLVFYSHQIDLIDLGTKSHFKNALASDADAFVTQEERSELEAGLMYERLAASVAPEIYGHEDLKKALILLLVGGMDNTSGGMRIRGSINICMMGDPGVAKSQLLSFISRLSPRSQYTTGRGSSGVGLTAAVMKDTLTE